MRKRGIVILSVLATLVLGGTIFFTATPVGRSLINQWQYSLKKTDEKTYEKQKEVEDTCRSYIASYNADKRAYYQYRDSESELERSWAQGYKQRANSTASVYNEYFIKNSYVWKDNIPSDIVTNLPYIED